MDVPTTQAPANHKKHINLGSNSALASHNRFTIAVKLFSTLFLHHRTSAVSDLNTEIQFNSAMQCAKVIR